MKNKKLYIFIVAIILIFLVVYKFTSCSEVKIKKPEIIKIEVPIFNKTKEDSLIKVVKDLQKANIILNGELEANFNINKKLRNKLNLQLVNLSKDTSIFKNKDSLVNITKNNEVSEYTVDLINQSAETDSLCKETIDNLVEIVNSKDSLLTEKENFIINIKNQLKSSITNTDVALKYGLDIKKQKNKQKFSKIIWKSVAIGLAIFSGYQTFK